MVYGIIAFGFTIGALNRLQDDDDEIEDYEKERNMVIKIPGTDIRQKIVLPWGFNFFFNVGDELAQMVFDITEGKEYHPFEGAARLTNVSRSWSNACMAYHVQ